MNKDNQKSEKLYQDAKVLIQQGNAVVAIALLTQAVSVSSDAVKEAQARMLRGEILRAMGDMDAAKEDEDWMVKHADVVADYYNKVEGDNPFTSANGNFKSEGKEGCAHSK